MLTWTLSQILAWWGRRQQVAVKGDEAERPCSHQGNCWGYKDTREGADYIMGFNEA